MLREIREIRIERRLTLFVAPQLLLREVDVFAAPKRGNGRSEREREREREREQ
jgi:hypothetical protein